MNICEALKEARKTGGEVYRPFGSVGGRLVIQIPRSRHEPMMCRVEYPFLEKTIPHPAWLPDYDDLIDEGWEVLSQEEKTGNRQEK